MRCTLLVWCGDSKMMTTPLAHLQLAGSMHVQIQFWKASCMHADRITMC